MATPVLLASLVQRGFILCAVADRLSVSPASALTASDRDAIRERRTELLGILSQGEPWNQTAAIKLMCDADELVGKFGVSGRHPEVVNAVAMVASACTTRDMETLRFAVEEFRLLIRRLARERVVEAEALQT
jgi:hypothetical protein